MAEQPKQKPQPIPIFHPAALKPALVFARQTGKLRKLRKPPRIRPSRAPEARYLRQLNAVLAELFELVRTKVLPQIPRIVAGAPLELRTRVQDNLHFRANFHTDVGEILEEIINDLRLAFSVRAPLGAIARKAGNESEEANAKDQSRIVEAVLGVKPELAEPFLEDLIDEFAETNSRLVTNVTDAFIDRLRLRISTRMREGIRSEEIAKEIERDFVKTQGLDVKTAKKRARLIARDQTASLQADVTRIRQTRIGVKRYVWRTAQDERVRSTHRERNGEIFVWGKPIGPQLRKKGLRVDTIDGPPGKPINCRCYPEPVLEDVVPEE